MSLETWKEEFYPVEANEVKGAIAATKHSLQKWIGLKEKNLKKHGMLAEGLRIKNKKDSYEEEGFTVASPSSCALCESFFKDCERGDPCKRCPIFKYKGRSCCSDGADSTIREYEKFVEEDDKNPEPMIRLLRKTLKWLIEKRRSK